MSVPRPTAGLRDRLAVHVNARRYDALLAALSRLRNAEFRMAGAVMGTADFWRELSDTEFWTMFRTLCRADARAYLGTLLKAAAARIVAGSSQPSGKDFETFVAEEATVVDRRKMLAALLPVAVTPDATEALLARLVRAEEGEKARVGHLFRAATPAAYFVLFRTLRHFEDDKNYLRRVAVELMRRGDKLSFNFAGILREYFALGTLPGTFALHLPPYELSRLDTHYDAFLKILCR